MLPSVFKIITALTFLLMFTGCQPRPLVFVMAGQSNMAGRAALPTQPEVNERILVLNEAYDWVIAREPFHFYEPKRAGLDCGMSFATEVIKRSAGNVRVAMIPCAVGGSSVAQWQNDETWRGVPLLTNFRKRVKAGRKKGRIAAILWHQGESDAGKMSSDYPKHLGELLTTLRAAAGDPDLPVIAGELGGYRPDNEAWRYLNEQLASYAAKDPNFYLVSTADFTDLGDGLHFDAASQRLFGQRLAEVYLRISGLSRK